MATPEQLAIIQKLIDKGASDEDIQTVVDHFKTQNQTKPIGKGEPDTYLGGFLKGAVEGGVGGGVGFAKEIIPGTLHAADPRTWVPGIAGLASDTVKSIYNFTQDPAKSTEDLQKGLLSLGPNAVKMIVDAAHLAATDPEAFGKLAADQTGGALVAVAASKIVPMMPKPIAQKIGQTLDQLGTKGAWPLRMMGAHQLGSGNPMGIATMMAPEALKAAAKPLIRFGTPPPAVTALAEETGAAPLARQPAIRVPYEPTVEQNATPPSETPAAVSGSLTEAEKTALRKAGQTDTGIAAVEAASIKRAGGTPPAKPNLGAGDINLTGPNVVPDRDFRGLSEQDLRNASSNDNWHTGRSGQMGSLPTETGLQVPDEESWFANKPSEMGTQADYLESQTHIPHLDIEGSGNVDAGNFPPGPTAGGSLGKFGEELLGQAGKPPEPTAGPVSQPKLDVPARKLKTKSRRSPMSATPGLTVEDMVGLGLDPKMTLTKVTQAVADKVLANRAARSQAYRTDAGLNRGFVDALSQDQP